MADSIYAWKINRGDYRDALINLVGCSMISLVSRGLPLEWSNSSGLGAAQRALGCETAAELVALVRRECADYSASAFPNPRAWLPAPAPADTEEA